MPDHTTHLRPAPAGRGRHPITARFWGVLRAVWRHATNHTHYDTDAPQIERTTSRRLGSPVVTGRRATRPEEETPLDTLNVLFATRLAVEARQGQIRQRRDELVNDNPGLKAVR